MWSSPVYISSFRRRLLGAMVWRFLWTCEHASIHSRWGISNSKETIYPSELWRRCAASSSKGLNTTAEALSLKNWQFVKLPLSKNPSPVIIFFFSFSLNRLIYFILYVWTVWLACIIVCKPSANTSETLWPISSSKASPPKSSTIFPNDVTIWRLKHFTFKPQGPQFWSRFQSNLSFLFIN